MSVVGEWSVLGTARYELGEGARAWKDGFVFVDLLDGELHSSGGTDGQEPVGLHDLDVPIGAVAPRVGGGWIAAAGPGIAFLNESGGPVDWVSRVLDGSSVQMRMNDGVADSRGRFWAGAMPYGDDAGTGLLLRVDPDGSVRVVLEGLTIPNGPAFTADGAVMYLAESTTGTIWRYRVGDDGTLADSPSVFAIVGDASPDGMTVDAEGYLWSALWGGSRVHRYAPDGELTDVVSVPAAQPTSVALSAERPGTIVVTTASHGLAEPTHWDGATLIASTTVSGVPTSVFGG